MFMLGGFKRDPLYHIGFGYPKFSMLLEILLDIASNILLTHFSQQLAVTRSMTQDQVQDRKSQIWEEIHVILVIINLNISQIAMYWLILDMVQCVFMELKYNLVWKVIVKMKLRAFKF